MSLIIWELTGQDTETGSIYRTVYKYDHSGMADEIDDLVNDVGGIDQAIQAQILEDAERTEEVS